MPTSGLQATFTTDTMIVVSIDTRTNGRDALASRDTVDVPLPLWPGRTCSACSNKSTGLVGDQTVDLAGNQAQRGFNAPKSTLGNFYGLQIDATSRSLRRLRAGRRHRVTINAGPVMDDRYPATTADSTASSRRIQHMTGERRSCAIAPRQPIDGYNASSAC